MKAGGSRKQDIITKIKLHLSDCGLSYAECNAHGNWFYKNFNTDQIWHVFQMLKLCRNKTSVLTHIEYIKSSV